MMFHNLGTILGMNRRNRDYVYRYNPRKVCCVADDKLKSREALQGAGIPMPRLVDVIETVGQIESTLGRIGGMGETVVVKPCRGSGGRGILFLRGNSKGAFEKPDGQPINDGKIRHHLRTILAGEFSLRSGMDKVIFEGYVRTHQGMKTLTPNGAPDIRILLFRGEPAFAMARIPTLKSEGKANLHQGAIGVGLNLTNGRGTGAVRGTRSITTHPDTVVPVVDLQVPFWDEVIKMSRAAWAAVPLGYAGLDLMIDEEAGPLVIEINAHPGLAIQLANGVGLAGVLVKVENGFRGQMP
jgi:alpha-L-glutamate ligase-like protein